MMTSVLNKKEIASLKKSGQILKKALLRTVFEVKPGVSTKELNDIAEKEVQSRGGICSFKNYYVEGAGKYPSSLCVSINNEIVHGLPKANRILKKGDICSLDLGVIFEGMCTDAAKTVAVGKIDPKIAKLLEVTEKSLNLGIKEAKVGNKIGSIGSAIQNYAESFGFGIVRDLVGHGVGPTPHTEPKIPNFGNKSEGQNIVEGMSLAIEPMITLGNYRIKMLKDGWTIVTEDGSIAAHFEDTIVIENGVATVVT